MASKESLMQRIREALDRPGPDGGFRTINEALAAAFGVIVDEIAEKPQRCLICHHELRVIPDGLAVNVSTVAVPGGAAHKWCRDNARNLNAGL